MSKEKFHGLSQENVENPIEFDVKEFPYFSKKGENLIKSIAEEKDTVKNVFILNEGE